MPGAAPNGVSVGQQPSAADECAVCAEDGSDEVGEEDGCGSSSVARHTTVVAAVTTVRMVPSTRAIFNDDRRDAGDPVESPLDSPLAEGGVAPRRFRT